MPYVNLPPGCSSLAFADGGKKAIAERPGGRVFVSDERARAIDSMGGNGTAGLVNGNPGQFFRARSVGRRCVPCNRRYFPFTKTCHRCGEATEPE